MAPRHPTRSDRFEGHGTHVADIIAGRSVDGLHKGVAPGASLLAVKVCSAVSSSCSGIALIQGMEFAVNPNGDGRLNDRVDVINMSLGSSYGQPFDDDLAAAVDNATMAGVLTVASAGNSADKPYANGTPAGANSALSVAQTSVPSAIQAQMRIVAPSSIAGLFPAVFQPWSSPLVAAVEAPLQYGNGAGGNLNGCAPFPADSLAGKIVLVDRGACNFTLKIKNVADAGGLIGIIGLIAPGMPLRAVMAATARLPFRGTWSRRPLRTVCVVVCRTRWSVSTQRTAFRWWAPWSAALRAVRNTKTRT